jgi:putative photosynthetic complex assembly protein 2
MSAYALPVAYTLFLWWFGTAVILQLGRLPRRTYRWSMLGATALLASSLYGIFATGNDTTAGGALLSFTFGIAAWAWIETGFLLGYITGPRQEPCPVNCTQWRRFKDALQTILYHELALLATGLVLVAVSWQAANPVGMWTFLILWGMRLSAKLNLFMGVRNCSEEFLPPHLRYLQTYFRKKPMNLLMPISLIASASGAALLAADALSRPPGSFELASGLLLASLLALAALEHLLMVLPMSPAKLWGVVPTGEPRA